MELRKIFSAVRRSKRFPRGESLVEVIIAVGVLMMIIGPAAALYISGDRAVQKNKKLLVGEQLAASGTDIMRSLYDTNLKRYTGKESQCWYTRPDNAVFDTCQINANLLISGSYILNSAPGNIVFSRMGAVRQLSQNLSLQGALAYQLKLDASGLYVHGIGEESPYYREINLVLTDIDNADADANNDTGADVMEVESLVRFSNGSKTQQAVQSLILTKP